ncbi:hypothetical protein ACFQBQ_09195 [Granulicella cerasi]|uniref:Uncharacterized protein n=1 Tax=Granulicella cerasi TaxID=741063 RepID=A0ABW1ZA20_9BACT|nr:hypothetical protein [Granulicella cerasi]
MSTVANALGAHVEAAAKAAGLVLTPAEAGTDFAGNPTVRAVVSLASDPAKSTRLELSEGFDSSNAKFTEQLNVFFTEAAERLKNPRPDVYLTMLGIPVSFSDYAWPFHGSTSGADTFVVHGQMHLENGEAPTLHAKVSASMTRTFAEVLPALEQPFAESFVYNAVRKTLDQGQLEMTKTGNRQIVPVTTRYYSPKQNRFIFNDTDADQRKEFVAGKVFWLSHVLGDNQPVWVADPRDAQYMNTTTAELNSALAALASEGLVTINAAGWASATEKLAAKRDEFFTLLEEGVDFTKPTFNEDMRAGNTNM